MSVMKHAYLILAHKDDYTFHSLISMLDDERNDIFIHMDIKTQGYDSKRTESLVNKSRVYHTERTSVIWGGFSAINAELSLLEYATGIGTYGYYHLISGEDLPIKTQDMIHRVFDNLNGKNCVAIADDQTMIDNRVKQYHFLQDKVGRNYHGLLYRIERTSLFFQKLLRIKRNNGISFYKGETWYSITDEFARYVVSRKDWIRDVFTDTILGDEIYMQTVIMNSEYADTLNPGSEQESIFRHIDWKRGNPYVFTNEDFDELVSSDLLFARKFVADVDKEIIKRVHEYVCESQ